MHPILSRTLTLALTTALLSSSSFADSVQPTSPQPIRAPVVGTQGVFMTTTQDSSAQEQRKMWQSWQNLWNGDYASADRIISPDFRLHAVLLSGASDTTIRGPAGLVNWIQQSMGAFNTVDFVTLVGPLIDGPSIAGRWVLTGEYNGRVPGAKAAPGTIISFAGTDILRVENGKIAEYWVSSDVTSLMAQLKIGAP